MQQVLFHIPFTAGLVTPEGVPVYGFGAMLFLTFVVVAMLWGPLRVAKVGMPKDKLQDMAIVLFLTGIAGARIVYMIQYSDQFPDQSPWGLVKSFFQIWNGGIVFYGSVFGGVIGYLLFRRIVLRRFNVSDWKLADAVAPLIALGLAIGRIGCYLNGCCWGQPVCEQCQPVPLSPELGKFPLLPAHARDQVVLPALEPDEKRPEIRGLQTSTGFTILPQLERPGTGDPRSVVADLEPASAAEKAGLKSGDRIIQVNGKPNLAILDVSGPADVLRQAAERLKDAGGVELGTGRFGFADLAAYRAAAAKLTDLRPRGLSLSAHDTLTELVRDWPRGVNAMSLVVQRGDEQVAFSFVPKTVPFFPTQLYETVSMVLLTFLLVAFQPFRRHNGQVMVLLMLGYAVHRFLNEAIRIEPTYALGLTLSQWVSVGIFAVGILLELYLRATQSKLPPGPLPLSYGVTPVPPAEKVPAVASA